MLTSLSAYRRGGHGAVCSEGAGIGYLGIFNFVIFVSDVSEEGREHHQ